MTSTQADDIILNKLDLGEFEVDIFKMCNLDKPFYVKMMTHLKAEYFSSETLKLIFKTYKKYFDTHNGGLPSRAIVEHILNNTKKTFNKDSAKEYLNRIFDPNATFEVEEREYITKKVVNFAKHARMIEAVTESYGILGDDYDNENEEVFEKVVSMVKDALMFNVDVEIGYDLYDIDTRYKNLRESRLNKIPTGFNQIDEVLDGGWARKELYCFMGPPGMGKSIFLPNIGFKALINGNNVVHYSLEMSEDRVGLRYDAISSGIHSKHLLDKTDEVKQKYETVKKLTKSNLKIKEFPTSLASVYDIEAHLDELKLYSDFEPDIIIIDYGDIMRSIKGSTKSAYEEQGWIFRELRGLAVKRNVVVITATQSTRDSLSSDGGTKEVIGMDQTADSMEKNRILDVLFSITQSRQEKDDGKINLWVAKNRNGKNNQYLEFMINYLNFKIKEVSLGTNVVNKKEDE